MIPASILSIVSLAGLALLVACDNGPTPPPVPVDAVEVTPAAAGVVIGQTVQLAVKVKDAAGHELADRPVTWTSSAPAQATVSPTGLVTGLALEDSVVITATSGGKSAGATITVVLDFAGEWNFTEQLNLIFWLIGGPSTGVATFIPCSDSGSYQFTQSGAEISGTKSQVGTCLAHPDPLLLVGSWDNTALPFPVADGRLSSTRISFGVGSAGCSYEGDVNLPIPLPPGVPPTLTLTGTYSCPSGTKGTWEATRGGAPVASVTARWDAQTVVGGAVQLVAVLRDAAKHVLSREALWSSDRPSVVTPSDDGLVTTLAVGSASITAKSEAITGSATVTADLVSFGSVSAGVYHSCAVRSPGSTYCWGWGGDGQLGTGFRPPARQPPASAETPLAVAGGRAFALVSSGGFHSCGVTPIGDAYCWGDNGSGQLGDGSTTSSLVPVPVTGGHRFASVTAGLLHSCGVTSANELYCWGGNYHGQLGDGSDADRVTPVLVGGGGLHFEAVRAGLYHTCSVTAGHEAYCWGRNLEGQLGNGTTAFAVTSPTAVQGSHSFVAVAAGFAHSCAISPDGAAYCWGDGSLLGDGSGVSQSVPVQVAGGPFATVDGALSAGQEHTCALTTAGAAYCWGHNDLGELGDGSTLGRSTPVRVSGGLSFAAISVGPFHTCGATPAAVAYCWGDNATGQLGADAPESCLFSGLSFACATAPMRVIGQPGAAAAGSLRVVGRMQVAAPEPTRVLHVAPLPPSIRPPRQ